MAPILFITKLMIVSGLMYGYYHFFLRNRKFHRYNRLYLLATSLLAIVIPFVKIPLHLLPEGPAGTPLAETLRVITAERWEEPAGMVAGVSNGQGWLTLSNGWWLLYLVGLTAGLVMLVRSLIYIARIRRRYPSERVSGIRLYDTEEPGAPFSFFSLIFWHQRIPFGSKEGQQVFRHELFHAKERHSADILWMQICCTVCWFNPFFYLIRKELKTIHEFLADEYAIAKNNPLDYAELLLVHSIGQKKAGLTSPMFQATIKRRIVMITQCSKTRYGYLSRLMILPVVLLLFCAFALRVTGPVPAGVRPAVQPITVVVDAGHGGIDPGAWGGKDLAEKTLTLQLARKIKSLEDQYNVHVLLTRKEDILPGNADNKMEGLENRVKMTKEAGATAFVSIHVNNDNDGDSPKPTTRSGFEAYISNRREYKGSEQLASALVKRLGSIYTTAAEIRKRKEEGIYVLDENTCSAVILECGYINNARDVKFFRENQEAIARSVLQGIVDYQAAAAQ